MRDRLNNTVLLAVMTAVFLPSLVFAAPDPAGPPPGHAGAEDRRAEGAATLEREQWETPQEFDLLLYGGKFNDKSFHRIIVEQQTDYRQSYVWVAGLNYKLGQFFGPVTVETEGLLAKHTGLQDHWEVDVLMALRGEWVWPGRFSFSIAIGDGFSLASEVPALEKEENPGTNALLQFLMVEFDFGFPGVAGWPRFMMRVHHRSGVFGLHCPSTCGSNFITYGIKIAF